MGQMKQLSREFWHRDVFYPRIAVARTQAQAIELARPGTIVVVRPDDRAKSLKMLCPCECGELLSINLMAGSGKAWRLTSDRRLGLSLIPSVWLDAGCQSHFILRNNTARMLHGTMPKLTEVEEREWWKDLPSREPSREDEVRGSGREWLG